jgi:hypothetical protein
VRREQIVVVVVVFIVIVIGRKRCAAASAEMTPMAAMAAMAAMAPVILLTVTGVLALAAFADARGAGLGTWIEPHATAAADARRAARARRLRDPRGLIEVDDDGRAERPGLGALAKGECAVLRWFRVLLNGRLA